MRGRRPDGTRVRDLSTVRAFMPFVSPQRNHSLVYFAQEVDVEAALQWITGANRDRPAERSLTLFHLILCALVRVLDERPRLNRFVAGGRLWQRYGIWITFSAKQRMDEEAPILTVKLRIDPRASIEEVAEQVREALRGRRAGGRDTSETEMGLLLRLPPPVIRLVLRAARALDARGLLPRRMIDADPLYASAFVANLGSVGLDAGYHHLWEHGTIPIFCVVGRVQAGPGGRRRVVLKYTYDERIADGLYCARGLGRLREMLEKPASLAVGGRGSPPDGPATSPPAAPPP